MAKVLSSISGNLISAASAGYAPTNSGDVSAIASAYQVVSATATQLYAGTAHVTSINSAPISASRAGNAANAGMANSAYYDGTGRLISALPDAAEVSAIASAYADDKLDKTAEVVTATAGDGTYVTSINGMEISGQGGGGAQVVTATGSAYVIEGSWPYTTSYLVSSINGSALLPYGYDALTSTKSAVSANSARWTAAASAVSSNSANWNSVYNTVSSNSASWSGSTGGGSVTSPSGTIVVMNDNEIEGTNSAVLTASSEEGFTTSFAAGVQIPSWTSQELYAGTLPGSGATLYIPTNTYLQNTTAFISGRDSNMAIITASGVATEDPITIYLGAIVSYISASANSYIPINGDVTAEKTGGITVTGIGELAWKSAVDNVTNTVSSNSATWGGGGGVDSATVSAIASSYAESAVSSKADSSALSSYVPYSGLEYYDTAISGIDGSPLYDYSAHARITTVAGRVTSLSAEMSSKADESALNGYYTTANESGFITGVDLTDYATTAYVDSAVSSKADSSALSSYVPYSSLEYNTASAISGINGSALAAGSTYSAGEGIDITDDIISVETPVDIVAGPGIVIDNPDGNTLRVSVAQAEEVELYDDVSGSTTPTLSETLFNFERCRVTYMGGANIPVEITFDVVRGQNAYDIVGAYFRSDSQNFIQFQCTTMTLSNGGVSATFSNGNRLWLPANSSDTQTIKCTKVVGIHRIASN